MTRPATSQRAAGPNGQRNGWTTGASTLTRMKIPRRILMCSRRRQLMHHWPGRHDEVLHACWQSKAAVSRRRRWGQALFGSHARSSISGSSGHHPGPQPTSTNSLPSTTPWRTTHRSWGVRISDTPRRHPWRRRPVASRASTTTDSKPSAAGCHLRRSVPAIRSKPLLGDRLRRSGKGNRRIPVPGDRLRTRKHHALVYAQRRQEMPHSTRATGTTRMTTWI